MAHETECPDLPSAPWDVFECDGHSVWVPGIEVAEPFREGVSKDCLVHRCRGYDSSEPTSPDDYDMREEVFAVCIQRLDLRPTRDCFATRTTAKCSDFFLSEEDALLQELDPSDISGSFLPHTTGLKRLTLN